MRFYCPDMADYGAEYSDLFMILNEDIEKKRDKAGNVYVNMGFKRTPDGLEVRYGREFLKRYRESRTQDLTAMSITDFMTAFDLDKWTANFDISDTFTWNIYKFTEIRTIFWFTVYTDEGVQFLLPRANANSKLVARLKRSEVEMNEYDPLVPYFDGDTVNGDYPISMDADTVVPSSISSDLREMAIKKEKAMNDVITFISGVDAKPLDFAISYDSIRYIILGKSPISDTKNRYYAVREITETYIRQTIVLLSSGKTYTISPAPYAGWADTGGLLTNGIIPTDESNYRVGFYPDTSDVEIVVDISNSHVLDHVRFNFLKQAPAGTLAPASLVMYGSTNGTDWSAALGTFVSGTDWSEADNQWTGAWSNNLSIVGNYQYIKFKFVGASNQMTIRQIEIYGIM